MAGVSGGPGARARMELYGPAVIAAFLITVLEMTEVVALVFALGADHASIRAGAQGATAGTAVVAVGALGFGALIIELPRTDLLWAAAVVLAGFGAFIFRSTLRSYRRAHAPPPSGIARPSLQFAGGFSVGVVEAVETVIVLLALAAAGYGLSAIVGAVAGGVLLVGVAAGLHDRIRRIKVPPLKLVATGLLFAFAVFWGGEAAGVPWPYADLSLVPLFFVAVGLARGTIAFLERRSTLRIENKG